MSFTRFKGEYEYEVQVGKIRRWMDYNFEAKVGGMIRRLPNGGMERLEPISLGFHVHHGETERDAEAKVDAEVDAWIQRQRG